MDFVDCPTDQPETNSCVESRRRRLLEKGLAKIIKSAYPNLRTSLNLAYVLERMEASIEASIEEQSSLDKWIYLRVSRNREGIYRINIPWDVAPVIAEVKTTMPIAGWWWLSKVDPLGPAVRLRIAIPSSSAQQAEHELASKLRCKGYDVRILRYEPELRLFGGPVGMKLAHELFFRDSEFLARWAQCDKQPQYPFIPVGLSLALIVRLAGAAGLDKFECWDVFDRLSDKRPLPPTHADNGLHEYREMAARVIGAGPNAVFSIYREERAQLLTDYGTQLDQCGRSLSRAYFNGDIECGLRELLVPIIIFHLNRAGFSWLHQTHLSHAAADEFRRLTRKGRSEQRSE